MHLSPTSKLGYLSGKRGFLLYILPMPKDTQLDTLYIKFYCRTLQYQGDIYVSKYFNTPPPKISSQVILFSSKQIQQ